MLSPRDPADAEYFAVLDAMAHSGLADIPQDLITAEQIRAVLDGQCVEPTASQRAAALRVGSETREFQQERNRSTKKSNWQYSPVRPRILHTAG